MKTYSIQNIEIQVGKTVKVIQQEQGVKGRLGYVERAVMVRKIKSIRKVKDGIKVHFEHTGEYLGYGFAVTFNENTKITMENI